MEIYSNTNIKIKKVLITSLKCIGIRAISHNIYQPIITLKLTCNQPLDHLYNHNSDHKQRVENDE